MEDETPSDAPAHRRFRGEPVGEQLREERFDEPLEERIAREEPDVSPAEDEPLGPEDDL